MLALDAVVNGAGAGEAGYRFDAAAYKRETATSTLNIVVYRGSSERNQAGLAIALNAAPDCEER